jgi:hypothetical protein
VCGATAKQFFRFACVLFSFLSRTRAQARFHAAAYPGRAARGRGTSLLACLRKGGQQPAVPRRRRGIATGAAASG